MARIFKPFAPSANKAAHPAVETKAPEQQHESAEETTAGTPATDDADNGKGKQKKSEGK